MDAIKYILEYLPAEITVIDQLYKYGFTLHIIHGRNGMMELVYLLSSKSKELNLDIIEVWHDVKTWYNPYFDTVGLCAWLYIQQNISSHKELKLAVKKCVGFLLLHDLLPDRRTLSA